MIGASRITIWIIGCGQPTDEVEAALRSVIGQGCSISCLADAATLEHLARRGLATPEVALVTSHASGSVSLPSLLTDTAADWIIALDATSRMLPQSLQKISDVIDRFDVDLLYGDSITFGGRAVRRPTFSPVRLRSRDYLGGLRGVRVAALRASGGFTTEASNGSSASGDSASGASATAASGVGVSGVGVSGVGAEWWDVALRLGVDVDRVVRIPEALTMSPAQPPVATENGRQVVFSHLSALGIPAEIEILASGSLGLRYPIIDEPIVSIIIPTRGSRALIRGRTRDLVVDAVRGIIERSTYPNVEFVVVADDATPQRVIDALHALAGNRLRLVRWSSSFNFSAKMNRGAVHAAGEYLLLLNDDVELISPDWIETMLGLITQPGIGLVGTLLFFEDGTVQHGGHLYAGGWAGHIAPGWPATRDDDLASMAADREVSGVTAACAMISADLYRQIGGFSNDYAGNYNDVDFAFKVRSTGKSIIWTPRARLFHFESKSRTATIQPEELTTIRQHWGSRMLTDPYWR